MSCGSEFYLCCKSCHEEITCCTQTIENKVIDNTDLHFVPMYEEPEQESEVEYKQRNYDSDDGDFDWGTDSYEEPCECCKKRYCVCDEAQETSSEEEEEPLSMTNWRAYVGYYDI